MATLLGTFSYYTDEEMVAQSDTELLGSMVESLTVEFDQERYEQFLFAGSVSPKATRKFRKVSQETPLSLPFPLRNLLMKIGASSSRRHAIQAPWQCPRKLPRPK